MRIGLLTILPTNFNIALGNLDYFKENKVFKFYKFVFSDSLSITEGGQPRINLNHLKPAANTGSERKELK